MSLTKRILKGDKRAISRLMRDIDDRIPSALKSRKELYLMDAMRKDALFVETVSVGQNEGALL